MKNLSQMTVWLSAVISQKTEKKTKSNLDRPVLVIKAGITDGYRKEYFTNFNSKLMDDISNAKMYKS